MRTAEAPDLPPPPTAVVHRLSAETDRTRSATRRSRKDPLGVDPLEQPDNPRALDRAIDQVLSDIVDRRNGKT